MNTQLMQPAQSYSTVIHDRYQSQSVSFHFIPSRSFINNAVPALHEIATILDAGSLVTPEIAPWHLTSLLASLQPDVNAIHSTPFQLFQQLAFGTPVLIDPHKLGFAEYAVFTEVIPFEESPLKGKSLMSIACSAGVTIGLVAGNYGPFVILTVPLGIVLCTAAAEMGPILGKKLPKLMGLP